MPMKLSTPLQEFFKSELQEDANATLEDAQTHLRELYDAGPGDPTAGSCAELLTETEELLNTYDRLKPLAEIVSSARA